MNHQYGASPARKRHKTAQNVAQKVLTFDEHTQQESEENGGDVGNIATNNNHNHDNITTTTTRDSPDRKPAAQPQFRLHSLDTTTFGRTNDEVHSSIYFNPVLRLILNTPYMQRLRHLKQLGTADYVYLNANHTRLEHSLGVAELAKNVMSKLRQRQPALHITTMDELCAQLAGLLHDVGHGPFSHSYEEFVNHHLPLYLKDHPELKVHYDDCPVQQQPQEKWNHEATSLELIDATLAFLGLQIDLSQLDAPLNKLATVWMPPPCVTAMGSA